MAKIGLGLLFVLFVLCVALPFLFKTMEGMDYSTKDVDVLPKLTIPEDEMSIADEMYKKYTKTNTKDISYNNLSGISYKH